MDNTNSDDKSNDYLVDLIQKNKIFAQIDRDACKTLVESLERVNLPQGEILFEQGDPSDCLYILTHGQLIASLHTAEDKTKIVGSINEGEIVGELGVVSKQLRSLTVRATKDCALLKLTHKQFTIFCKENPKFITLVIDLIIQRSHNALKVISQKKLHQHIAIVKNDDSIPIDLIYMKLKENLDEKYDFIVEFNHQNDAPAWQVLEKAELENKSVIFLLNEKDFSELQSKLNHIGGVFFIVNGDKPGELSRFATSLLDKHKILFTHSNQFELILLHGDHISHGTGTADWLNQAEFTLHHHIRLNNNADYQRLLRFMMSKEVGLVLGGGGNKGWASLGAMKALLDANVPIDIIGGSSVGAIVAACYIVNQDYQATTELFEKLILTLKNPFSFRKMTWPIVSLLSTKYSTQTLMSVFDNIQIEDLFLPFFIVTSNLSTGKEVIFRQGTLWEALRATIALPGLVPPMVIEGEIYLDGGLVNNLPVDNMRQLLGPDSTIVAVSLTGHSGFLTNYNFPPMLPFRVGLLRKLRLAYREYRFPSFFNLFVNSMLLGSSTKEKNNAASADILICPDLAKFRSFEFGIKEKTKLIEIGYDNTRQQLAAYKAPANKWRIKP